MRRPPGEVDAVSAERVLVLAPHYDDEVLGCGGLLARLTAAGAEARVLFLSDGGGDFEGEERRAFSRRRRAEAEAAGRRLGLGDGEYLDLPDGRLEQHLEEMAEAIGRELPARRPDLLLAPSPLEVSADHRAAFAALHRLLAPLRGGGELDEVAAGLTVLLYEVNHPFYPDLLVDVSGEIGALEAAMACHASQQERHDYLAAALGLRRFRTLTLPPGVAAAEGYCRLGLADFTTRSPAQLVRHLGGEPRLVEVREGPKISVVVRTKDRPRLLAEALASLAASTYRRAEVVLVNDGGAPPSPPADFPLPLTRVELPEDLGRAAAANAGVEAAGGDYVAFLDDDDLAAPEHLATLAGLVSAAGVRVAYTDAAVGVYELAGGGEEAGWACRERRLPYSRDFDRDLLHLDNYIPFNTLLIERRLFAEAGPFDAELPFFEDWDFLIRLARLTPFHHLARVTCEYRHFRGGAHHVFGESPRRRADFLAVKARVVERHRSHLDALGLARAVDTLRAEAVRAAEEAASRHRAQRRAEEGQREAERRYHLLNGEMAALKGDHDRARGELERAAGELARLYDEERALRAAVAEQGEHLGRTYAEIERLNGVVGEQGEHLGRTYAEIERLNGLIREMEQTRAWRLHQWWQGKKHAR